MDPEDVRTIVRRKRTYDILEYLSGTSGRNYSEIASEIESSSDTVTQTLDLLCEYGLVERNRRSKKDVEYEITPEGDEFLATIEQLVTLLSSESE